ncbi:muconolactone Delta-isomerase [Amorphoplanes digitatis]|nr:muconolactone Delta-isomerase [Actinoplanes digitatis]
MLFAVTMEVALPHDLGNDARNDILAREKAYSLGLQRAGEWVSIWRIAGRYANLSIFDVASNDRLHEILWNLPLFRYMTIEVTPLARHPSDLSLTLE